MVEQHIGHVWLASTLKRVKSFKSGRNIYIYSCLCMCAQHILIAMLHAEMAAAPSLVRVMLIALTVLMEERNAAGDVYRRCQKNIALVN